MLPMWSGNKTLLAAVAVLSLSACATQPSPPPWFSSTMFEELANTEEYSDFLAGRYAGMSGDPVGAAEFYRRSFERSPNDANLLERAMLSTLIAGSADEAVALAVRADATVSAQSPAAQFALAINEVVTGKHRRAAARLKTGGMGAINADAAGFLASWLIAVDNPDAGLAYLDQLPPRRLLAGEQQALRGLILASANRTDEALAAFEQASRLPTGSPGFLLLHRAQLAARMSAFRPRPNTSSRSSIPASRRRVPSSGFARARPWLYSLLRPVALRARARKSPPCATPWRCISIHPSRRRA
jgi:hypothetical protein